MGTLNSFVYDIFGVPAGGLWGNLVASAVLGICGFFYGRVVEKRAIGRHEELMKQKDYHHKLQMQCLESIHNLVKEK